MKFTSILKATPFLILIIILGYTWCIIMTTDYFATTKHIIALILALCNLVLYFLRFRYAIFFTGIILILASLNLLAFFPDMVSTSYFIKIGNIEVATPSIQWKLLLIFVFYCIVNFNFLINLYLDYKEKRKIK
jgi:hypothetical protein